MDEEIKKLVDGISSVVLVDAGILLGNGGGKAAADILKRIAADEGTFRTGCEIKGLLTPEQSQDSPTQLWVSPDYPDARLQVTVALDGTPQALRLTWALIGGMRSPFRVCSIPSNNDPEGVLMLYSPHRAMLEAKCVDAAVTPGIFTPGMDLNGWLNMYVSQVHLLDSGEERKEADYGLGSADGPPAYATATGRIMDVHRMETAGNNLTRITIDIVPEDGDLSQFINLYVHDDVLGGKSPEWGGLISCSGLLHFEPDALIKQKEGETLRTIKDVHFRLRHEMGLVYYIDMEGDTLLDQPGAARVFLSFQDPCANSLNSGNQADIPLGSIRFFSKPECNIDAGRVNELCQTINQEFLAKAYYDGFNGLVVEHYLIPDGAPLPVRMFEYAYKHFVQEVKAICDKINMWQSIPDEDDA